VAAEDNEASVAAFYVGPVAAQAFAIEHSNIRLSEADCDGRRVSDSNLE